MIHLDTYEWEGETFLRAWDTEPPEPQRQIVRITEAPEKIANPWPPKPLNFWQKFWSRDWEKP